MTTGGGKGEFGRTKEKKSNSSIAAIGTRHGTKVEQGAAAPIHLIGVNKRL
jgi:hypothetical protein